MEDLEGLSTKEKLELLRKRRQRVEKEAEERIQKEKEDEEKQLKAIEELLARTEKEAREELEERLRESASEAPLDALEEELMQQTHEDYEQKKPEEPPVVAYNEEGFGTQDKYAPLTSGGSVGDFLSLRKESQYRSLSVEEQSFVSLMSYHVNVSNAEFLGSQKQGGIEELASYATPTLNVEVLRMVDAPKQNDVQNRRQMIHQDDLPDNIFREHRIEQPIFLEEDFTKGETTFGPKQIGTTTNPMASPLESFKAKLREGVGKIEFGFLGSGKTSSQQPSPEAVSAEERLALRNLVRINKVRTSTHAAVHMGGLGGFNPESGSFSDAARGRTLREIERAVDFAADATDGGAIVFHVGEFTRPVSEIKEKTGDKLFETYEDEGKTGQELIVDTTTGKVTGLPKDQPIIIPKWTLAKDKGLKVGQKYESVNGDQVVLREGDYIDQIGRIIPRYDLNNYDKRIPEGELSKDKYETEELNWEKLGKRAEQENKYIAQWNKEHPDKQVAEVTAAVLFARLQKEQQLLQAEGQINYYQQGYEGYIRRLEEEKKIPEYEKEIETLSKIVRDEKVPQKDRENYYQRLIQLQNRVDSIPEEVRDARRHFSHAHASVTAATAQREQAKKEWNALQDPETYAVKRAAETIAKVGMETYYKTKQIKPKEAFFAAPEHWAIESFGSHPEELKKLVLSSREQMVKQLVKTGVNEEEAKKLAKTHIKATIDTGHLNMWRSRFKRNPGESAEDRDKRYHKWYLEHMEKLAKEGIVGHAHLADNFGWDDEHLTPGQGNAPIKETMKIFERFGMNDTVVEPGSFNPLTAMPETWRMLGSPIYAVSQPGRSSWRSIYQADSGFGRAPSQYMQGEYVPSKENWQLWSQTPLE